ncbi:hypothetical protein MTO96_049545 [Rhipicephalus appendiculatus]
MGNKTFYSKSTGVTCRRKSAICRETSALSRISIIPGCRRKRGDTPEEVKKVDVSANKSFPRRKPPSQNQSTPYRVPLFPEHLPSWPMSPVKRTAPPVPTQSAATRQRVQAMLDESFARHMTARNTFVTAPSVEVDGMDAQLKKSLAELTNSLEKTYLV